MDLIIKQKLNQKQNESPMTISISIMCIIKKNPYFQTLQWVKI